MTAAPEGLERLLALDAIRLLRAKYCRYIDAHEFDRLADVLSDDCVLDMSPTAKVVGADIQPIFGKIAIIDLMNVGFAPLKKLIHITTLPIIEFQDGEHATGVWRQDTYVGEALPDLDGTAIAYATASDTYRKDDGHWRITSVRIEIDVVV